MVDLNDQFNWQLNCQLNCVGHNNNNSKKSFVISVCFTFAKGITNKNTKKLPFKKNLDKVLKIYN